MTMEGIVTQIQRFSVHDGPGIRTTVFMKGCNLRCIWCHNPETYSSKPEVEYFANKCTLCGRCVAACPTGRIRVENGKLVRDGNCISCFACEDKCVNGATIVCGKRYTPQALCDILLKDVKYYQKSGGGVTFSGGEALLQSEFVFACVDILKNHGINCAVETASNVRADIIRTAAEKIDYFMCDVKAMDSDLHKRLTGVPNDVILKNIKLLSTLTKNILIRVPVAMTLNGTDENMRCTAKFMRDCGLRNIELLKLHHLAQHKYNALGIEEQYPDIPETTDDDIEHFYGVVNETLNYGDIQ